MTKFRWGTRRRPSIRHRLGDAHESLETRAENRQARQFRQTRKPSRILGRTRTQRESEGDAGRPGDAQRHECLPRPWLREASRVGSPEALSQLCEICRTQNIHSAFTPPLATNQQLCGSDVSAIIHGKQSCGFCMFIYRILEYADILRKGPWDPGPLAPDVYLDVSTYDKEPGCRINIRCGKTKAGIFRTDLSSSIDKTSTSAMPREVWPIRSRAVGQTVDPMLLQRWFGYCAQFHDHDSPSDAVRQNAGRPNPGTGASRFRLVDVEKNCIIEADMKFRYACLSYVWGGAKPLRLDSENHARLTRSGGLEGYESVPRAFWDAIQVSKMLGIEFIWIDALCIQHDDKRDLAHQIINMDLVYKNAVLTIVSATAHADIAIPGIAPGSRDCESIIYDDGEMQLMYARPTFTDAIRGSAWESRGWTLQEKFFSKRLLVFTRHQAYYHCREATWAEDTAIEPLRPEYAATELTCAKATLIKSASSIIDHEQRLHSYDSFTPGETRLLDLFQYQDLLKEYATRRLTHQTDVLAAFSGILNHLSPQIGPDFFGLPEWILDSALLWKWSSHHVAPRRIQFPSWSWCGWQADPEMELEWLVAGEGHKEFFWYLPHDSFPKRLENGAGVLDILPSSASHRRKSPLSIIAAQERSRQPCPLHVLQFHANTLYLSIESYNSGYCNLYCNMPGQQKERTTIGKINLAKEWREQRPVNLAGEFIHMSSSRIYDTWYKRRHGTYALPPAPGNSSIVKSESWNLMLVDTDKEGHSQRVQVCSIIVEMNISPKDDIRGLMSRRLITLV
jgi:hypothetical protein